jgi:toxin HigB-1
MIQSFADARCERFFREGICPAKWQSFENVAHRKLDMLDAANELIDLRSPPGNRLEALTGTRLGQYSIRINDKYRLCFKWTEAGPIDVEIVDYH